MKIKAVLNLFLLFYSTLLFSQNIIGFDFRIETNPDTPALIEKHAYADLYIKSVDTIAMDSLTINPLYFTPLLKQEHLFLEDDIQLLRFFGELYISDFGVHTLWTRDTFFIEGINNFYSGAYAPIQFSSKYTNWDFNCGPVFNKDVTEVNIQDGILSFDASGIDPDGQNLGYFLIDVWIGGFYQYYDIPQGIELDSVSGQLTWILAEPGKYLLCIGYSESNSQAPGHWGVTAIRYMVLEVKVGDIVFSNYGNIEPQSPHFSVFPNPAQSTLNLTLENLSHVNDGAILAAHNLLGQPVYQAQLPPTGSSQQWEVDVSGWPPGLYLLSLEANGQVWTEKVVVQ